MKVERLLNQGLMLGMLGLAACTTVSPDQRAAGTGATPTAPTDSETVVQAAPTEVPPAPCQLVEQGYGPPGQVPIRAEAVVSGLEVPWGMAFLPNGDLLVTERAGRVRLVQGGTLRSQPIATIATANEGEGGLLGIAVHPEVASNGFFYVYYTANQEGRRTNRVERWRLAEDGLSATRDRTLLDGIPVAQYHNGGRIRFGPDGLLYIGTGDARNPETSQDVNSLAGKILRLTPDGEVPADNPFPGSPVYILGIRNTQGFDWIDNSTLWITDHGPSGELGRRGHDKAAVAQAGDNLGWPTLDRCESGEGLVTPSMVWRQALPPGGSVIYTGDAIPEWRNSLIIATLRSQHLQRVAFDPQSPEQVQRHEVYLEGQYGRLRDAVMGPDGELYVTTSNCDGRGSCPPEQDKILRITR